MRDMDARVAIIGGTGLDQLPGLTIERRTTIATPYGEPSAPLSFGHLGERARPVVFLPRHGDAHSVAPHQVNYRANLRALRDSGAHCVLAVAAVGGIGPEMAPARLAFPSQLIDYTYGREHTFFDRLSGRVEHIDFTAPYDATLHRAAVASATALGLDHCAHGTYGATQGPRLETAAEIERMARDGCDLVGMTGMPEAALARELDLPYLCIAVVVNWAAGKDPMQSIITLDEIQRNLVQGMGQVLRLLPDLIERIQPDAPR